MNIRGLLVIVTALPVLAAAAGSQPTGLPPVPTGLSTQETTSLSQQRARVVSEGERLQKLVEGHHAQCAHVGLPLPTGQTPSPEDEALKQRCETEQAEISTQLKRYNTDTLSYRKAVDASLAKAATANGAYAARVVLKGTVRLGKPGQEQQLTSSRVIQLSSGEHLTTAPHARAAFQLSDGRELIAGPQTDLSFVSMVNDPQPSKRRVDLRLTTGTLRWIADGSRGVPGQQPTVTLSPGVVRLGTGDFQASVSTDGSGYLAVFKGDAKLEDAKSGRTVVVKAQEMTVFGGSGGFGPPAPLKAGQVKGL